MASSHSWDSFLVSKNGWNIEFSDDYKLSFKQFDYDDLKNKLELLEDRQFSKKSVFKVKNFIIQILILKF